MSKPTRLIARPMSTLEHFSVRKETTIQMTEQRVRNGAMILVRDRGVELRKGAELELQCESSVLLAQPMNKIKDWLSMQDTNATKWR